jgi:DNA polymerase-3 subunit delta'
MKAIYPWQQSQWQHLLTQQQSRRLPQALLFSGQRGLGKKDFALALAELVLCETGSEIACGICHSCQLFRAGSHPDFFMVYPEEEGKTIKVDQIRDLTASLNQTAQLNGYQVAVICPAEAMNVAAANALLKTLEEPPGPVLIILISHHLGGLPITIVSRCQKIAFFATDYAKTLNWLAPQVSGGEEQAQRLLKMANGAPLLALELASVNYLSLRDALLQHLVAMQQEQKNPIQGVDADLVFYCDGFAAVTIKYDDAIYY